MKELYCKNLDEIQRQEDLIKKHEWEKQELMNRIARLDSTIDRKKRIVNKKKIENKFILKHDLMDD